MYRAKKLEQEAQVYVNERCKTRSCTRALHLIPTLNEIQSLSFSEYVRLQIISRASADDSDDSDDDSDENDENENNDKMKKPDQVQSSSSSQKDHQDDDEEEIEWNRGIAKVTLPKGFWDEKGIANDRTGRGPQWQKGTPLGDLSVRQPIQQVLDGIGGIYEYTLLEKSPMPLWKFRMEADAYKKKQLGYRRGGGARSSSSEEDDSDDYWDDIAKRFWKRLGPTMAHPLYGADMEGSLFGGEEASGWSLEHLDNCLKLLDASDDTKMPGVTTPYLYVGMFASVFCAHTEDMDLCSINYLHCGAPKYWYAIAPAHSKRFESFCNSRFLHSHRACPDYLRHKQSLISPTLLKKAGIPFETAIQRPGDAILTYPGAYHFGVNLGFNIAEAVNFGVPEWIPLGRRATVCMCRPSSVRLDMDKFEELLTKYETDVENAKLLGFRKLSYRQWAKVEWNRRQKQKKEQEEQERKQQQSVIVPEVVHVNVQPSDSTLTTRLNLILPANVTSSSSSSTTTTTTPPTMASSSSCNHINNAIIPSSSSSSLYPQTTLTSAASTTFAPPTVSLMYDKDGKARMDKVWVTTELAIDKEQRKEDFWIEIMSPIATSSTTENNNSKTSKKRPRKQQQKQQQSTSSEQQQQQHEEQWRLAKPFVSKQQRRKKLIVGCHVLVLLPSSTSSSSQDVCFAGQVVKVSEDHVLIHFSGLSKREDIWISITSNKLFLDGGKWQEPTTTNGGILTKEEERVANISSNKRTKTKQTTLSTKKQTKAKKGNKKKQQQQEVIPTKVASLPPMQQQQQQEAMVMATTLVVEQQTPIQQPQQQQQTTPLVVEQHPPPPQPEKVASG